MISGKATDQGTKEYAEKHAPLTYMALNGSGLQVSRVGFGGYRVDATVEIHQQALRQALLQGINLVDTSSNYADGGSEKLVGQIIGELAEAGKVQREAMVVVSKVGYLQGQNYELSQQRKAEGNPFPDLVEYGQGLEHCIHPVFLEDQLERSRQRLNMATIDGYLLHNPEYYLSWAQKTAVPLDEARAEFYRRIEKAFRYLEEKATQGLIQWYGISSNTFPYTADHPQFTSLETVWNIAESISPGHHFRIIQLPMNLYETEAATEKNQTNGRSVLDFAQEKKLAVLINRPLNAIYKDTLLRLADVPLPASVAAPQEVSTTVDTSVKVETAFRNDILPLLSLEENVKKRLLELVGVGIALQGSWRGFGTYHNWRDVQSRFLFPRAQSAVQFLSNRPNLPPEAASWLDRYVNSVNDTFEAVTAYYQSQAATQAKAIKETAVATDAEWEAETLSQTAVRALRATAGVTTVLVGMRQSSYVDDILADLQNSVTPKNRDEKWQKLAQPL